MTGEGPNPGRTQKFFGTNIFYVFEGAESEKTGPKFQKRLEKPPEAAKGVKQAVPSLAVTAAFRAARELRPGNSAQSFSKGWGRSLHKHFCYNPSPHREACRAKRRNRPSSEKF